MEFNFWVVGAGIFIAIEILSMGLTSIWFGGGAIIAAIAAYNHAYFLTQAALFFAVSLILVILTRPFAKHVVNNNITKTNVDALIGRVAVVTEPINNLKAVGQVVVSGQVWTARSTNDDVILEKDKKVIIRDISGVKLIVEEKEESA